MKKELNKLMGPNEQRPCGKGFPLCEGTCGRKGHLQLRKLNEASASGAATAGVG